MKKRIFSLILIVFLLFSMSGEVFAFEITSFKVEADSAMLVSLDTGEVLYSKNENKKINPAGVLQIMTAAVILENVEDIENYEVTVTQSAYNRILGTGCTVLNCKVGEKLKGKDALAAILMCSAGDVIYAYCEAVGGTVENFVSLMNKKAQELSMKDTFFVDPIGISDEGNTTTAEDMEILSRYVLANYPVFAELTSKSRYKIDATNMSSSRMIVTTNYMIDQSTNYFYTYCNGTKTGYTEEAGRCLAVTASYKGYNYLILLFGCKNTSGSRSDFLTAREMFRWAFNNFEYKEALDTSVPIAEIPVKLSSNYDYVSLYPEKQITSILPKEADNSTLIIVPHFKEEEAKAPIKKGDVLGTAEVIYAERVIGTVNLVAGNDIESSFVLIVVDFFEKLLPFIIGILVILVILAVIITIYVVYINSSGKKKKKKIKYIPYDEEKERIKKEKLLKRRKESGRPTLNLDDKGNDDL